MMRKIHREGKANADYGATGRTVGKRSWGEREKEQGGLAPSLGLGEGGSAVRMSSGKTKGRPG